MEEVNLLVQCLKQQIKELSDRVDVHQEKLKYPGFPVHFRLKPSQHKVFFPFIQFRMVIE